MSNLNESYSIDWFETSLKMNFSHFCYQINLHCLDGSLNQKFFLNYLLKIQIITYFQSRLFVCAFVLSINSQLNSKVKNRTCFGGVFFPDGSLVGSNVLCTSELKSWLKNVFVLCRVFLRVRDLAEAEKNIGITVIIWQWV